MEEEVEGYAATKLIEREVEHSKGWCIDAQRTQYLSYKAVVAGIKSHQIVHHLPCGGWKLPCKQVA
uniref:Uncharacterized protein n=1 Tax=Oryza nivara TaxID=4536 RepID=A0A0E0G1H8_ORYNI